MATAHAHATAAPRLAVRVPALLELTRPANAAMASLAVLVGAYVQAGAALPAREAALAALAGFAFAGAGNALNDYLDRGLDARAHPRRPLPAGRALPRDALRLQGVLFAASAGLAALVSPAALAFVLAALALMLAYELRLKAAGLPGNAAIAALTGVPFLFGAVAAGALGAAVFVLAALAALANLGREIVKDVEDVAGDVGRRTLPMRLGPSRATRGAQLALLAAVALSPLPAVVAPVAPPLGLAYLPLVALADAGFLASAALASQPGRAQRLAKAAMLVALVAFAAGRASA